MGRTLEADYLVVGAGAAGMAFCDALLDNNDEVRVVLVDRRSAPGGHWVDAYPFVRLHQASSFYGVASIPLGGGKLQDSGPETGMHERATGDEVRAYYQHVLERWASTGRLEFFPSCSYSGEGRFISLESGDEYDVTPGRVVDATYLSPDIPATTPPPFEVGDGARVIPVNALPDAGAGDGPYVVTGSGKTATDACIWLLQNGVDPDDICWVRPRDPWMLNRAVIQPDPAVFIAMAADVMQAAAAAEDLDDLFLRMEDAGIVLRIDRSVRPTMAKTPTLARWELDHLRSLEQVVRLGHVRRAESGRLLLDDGEVAVTPNAVVVHCAAAGLQYPPLVPIWQPDAIRPQPVRVGFPCFGAALIGYVEATRDDDAEKNRICPPSPLSDTLAGWARMQVLGARAAASFSAQPDIKAWANEVLLNPTRIPAAQADRPELQAAVERLRAHSPTGLAKMAELSASWDRP